MQANPKLKRPRGYGKFAVSRHTDQSKTTCDRLERSIEKTFRQEGKRAIREEFESLEYELKKAVPGLAQSLVERLKKALPLMQKINDLAEDAREAVWCSNDPNDASEALDELIDLAVKAGAVRRDRDDRYG